jgi:hypothetical protein
MPNTIIGTLLLENQLFGQFMALMYVLVILLWCIPFFFYSSFILRWGVLETEK